MIGRSQKASVGAAWPGAEEAGSRCSVNGNAGRGGQLHFNSEKVEGTAVQMKICEGYCGGRVFYRPAGSNLKICKACVAAKTKLREVN